MSLIATLIQAAIISVLLILAPLKALPEGERHTVRRDLRLRAALYFFGIGLAFIFTEIAFIQKFILYLANPLYAIAVVLAGFLWFAGAGSAFAARFEAGDAVGKVVRAVGVIVLVSALYLILLPPLFEASMGLAAPAKVVIVLGLIAPVAFCMGMPFPLGLSRLAGEASGLIPWVWGVNGCASVIAAILATLLAIHAGQSAVLILALLMYSTAAWLLRG